MASFLIDGRVIQYKVTGEGAPVLLTPGGRLGMNALASLAAALGTGIQLIQWDRCNAGASDVWIDEPSEQQRWADDLPEFLHHLGLSDAYLIGGSAGARVSLLGAIRHPEIVRGLVLWSVSGGPYACQLLGYQYHTPYINAAILGGMAEVIDTPYYRELIEANPGNRERLLAIDPDRFIAVMRRWNEDFYAHEDVPVIGASVDDLSAINAPTLVFGGNDDFHPVEPAEAAHDLIKGSEYVPCAWSRDDWMWRSVGRIQQSVLELYPRMTGTILEFIQRTGESTA
jgi:pimeloyl-ACP methyl ester carboxylesterase